MKLSQLITPSHLGVVHGRPPKGELMEDLLDRLLGDSSLKNEPVGRQDMLTALLDREKSQTTAVGDAVAFPHARLLGLKGVYHYIAVCPDGVDFNSLDEQPVHLLLLSLVSRETPTELLRARAAFVRFLASQGGAHELSRHGDAGTIWELLDRSDVQIDQEIVAKDLMRPPAGRLSADTSLRDAARVFHMRHADSLPVVAADGVFLGELSCIELFRVGLPDFFQQLHTVSFVKHMNPFEKYFQVDQSMCIGELLKREPQRIPAEATVMEIIFEMAVHDRSTLYVTDEQGKLLGVIDRFSIIDKVLISNVEKPQQ